MTEVLSIENHLKKIFPNIDVQDLKVLENAGESYICHKGDLIVKQGTICQGILLLVNGKSCIKVEQEKVQNIVHFLVPGETFYVHEAYLKTLNKTSCYCMETSLLFTLPLSAISSLLIKHPTMMFDLINLATRESELFEQRATNLISLPVKFRFIDSLLTLIKKFAEQKPDHLFIPIKRDEIGSYINASKASLSRVVTELEKRKIIKTSRQGILIYDQQALTDIT